jgi:hypothetical protein
MLEWQRDYNAYSLEDDHDSQVWLKDLMSNSLDPELKKQVEEKYMLLDEYNCEIIDLSAHWGKLLVEHVGRWQRDYNYNGYSLDSA